MKVLNLTLTDENISWFLCSFTADNLIVTVRQQGKNIFARRHFETFKIKMYIFLYIWYLTIFWWCFTSWWQRHKWGVTLLLFVGFGSVCVQSETLPWHCLFRQFPRSSILLFLRTTTCKKSKQTLPKYSEITLFFFFLPAVDFVIHSYGKVPRQRHQENLCLYQIWSETPGVIVHNQQEGAILTILSCSLDIP